MYKGGQDLAGLDFPSGRLKAKLSASCLIKKRSLLCLSPSGLAFISAYKVIDLDGQGRVNWIELDLYFTTPRFNEGIV